MTITVFQFFTLAKEIPTQGIRTLFPGVLESRRCHQVPLLTPFYHWDREVGTIFDPFGSLTELAFPLLSPKMSMMKICPFAAQVTQPIWFN
jgi:hypothetical protein